MWSTAAAAAAGTTTISATVAAVVQHVYRLLRPGLQLPHSQRRPIGLGEPREGDGDGNEEGGGDGGGDTDGGAEC